VPKQDPIFRAGFCAEALRAVWVSAKIAGLFEDIPVRKFPRRPDVKDLHDEVRRCLACKECVEIVERAEAHGVACFQRGAAQVGEQESVGQGAVPGVYVGFIPENIEPRGGEGGVGKRTDEGIIIDQISPGGVDQDCAFRQPAQAFPVDNVACFRCGGSVQRKKIACRKEALHIVVEDSSVFLALR